MDAKSPPADVEHVLVEDGESREPVFSPDGEKILFVSAKRKGHQLAQVYEKSLTSGDERRITFQAGHTSLPAYHPRDNLIAYASSTDELKEQPLRHHAPISASEMYREFQEQTEVYTHNLSDYGIHRISRREGFDGEPRFQDDGSLSYTRATPNSLEIMRSSSGREKGHWLKDLGHRASSFFAKDRSKISGWLEWNPDFLSNVIKIKKGSAKPVSLSPEHDSLKLDLRISPDARWIFWSQVKPNGIYEIWAADVETLCPRALIAAPNTSFRHPSLAPNSKAVAYTRIDKDRSRIMWRTFEPPPSPCAPAR